MFMTSQTKQLITYYGKITDYRLIIMTIEGVTCRPEGSGILLVLVLLDVIVIEFDRDDRLLRAEEGREDDRLSEMYIHTHQTQT